MITFTRTKTALRLLLFSTALLMAAGCTDHEQLKRDALQAAAKQETVQSYKFTGQTKLSLNDALFKGAPPLTAAMLSVFKQSTLDYEGLASLENPLQLEATAKITPKDAASAIELPILLKDSKLYLHLPAVNKPDEFLMLPLAEADKLKQSGRLSAGLTAGLLQGADARWLEAGPKDELFEGKPAKRITLTVTEKNRSEVDPYLSGLLPSVLGELVTGGLATDAQSEQWKAAISKIHVEVPSSYGILIDGDGYIREQTGRLTFSLEGAPGVTSSVEWSHRADDLGKPPAFQREVPQQVKNVSDLLRLLGPKP